MVWRVGEARKADGLASSQIESAGQRLCTPARRSRPRYHPGMATLRYAANGKDQEIGLDDEAVTIGRQLGNLVTLDKDDRVSRFHAVVEYRRGVLGVRDLGSRNGTLVNGEKVEKGKRLRTGDVVQIGMTKFVVDLGDGKAETNGSSNGDAAAKAAGVRLTDEAGGADKLEAAQSARQLAQLAGQLPERNVKPADMQLYNARPAGARSQRGEGCGRPERGRDAAAPGAADLLSHRGERHPPRARQRRLHPARARRRLDDGRCEADEGGGRQVRDAREGARRLRHRQEQHRPRRQFRLQGARSAGRLSREP